MWSDSLRFELLVAIESKLDSGDDCDIATVEDNGIATAVDGRDIASIKQAEE